MSVEAKICGIKTMSALNAAIEGGAAYVGFVFFPQSPRHLNIDDAAALAAKVPQHVSIVAVVVDATQQEIAEIDARIRVDVVQLHGTESPEKVSSIRNYLNIHVMKALSIATKSDLEAVPRYAAVADMLLFDAKADGSATRPGGNALSFDWTLLMGRTIEKPWMVSGGLNAHNVGSAVRRSGARLVDVSSGVERAPGEKDPKLIREFLDAVKRL